MSKRSNRPPPRQSRTARNRQRTIRIGGIVLVVAIVVLLVLSLLPTTGGTQEPGAAPPVELLDQTVLVTRGQPVTFVLDPTGAPADGSVEVAVHDRVRSRSELSRAFAGNGLRATKATASVPLASLGRAGDGSVTVVVPTGSAPDAIDLATPGVYPTTLSVVDGTGAAIGGRVVTQLVVPPAEDAAVPLSVALVADLDLPTGRPSDELPEAAVDALRRLAEAIRTEPDLPVTLAVEPEALRTLTAAPDDDRALATLEALRSVVEGRAVLARPFVPVAPDALIGADLDGELRRQLDLGDTVLRAVLGVEPQTGTWLTDAPLGREGLTVLRRLGFDRVVLPSEDVAPTVDRVFTLARPFALVPPPARGTAPSSARDAATGLTVDRAIAEELAREDDPSLLATRTIAALATVWFEQPTAPRAVVVRVDPTTPAGTVEQLVRALAAPSFLRPVELTTAFTEAEPLADARGNPRTVALTATDVPDLATSMADRIRTARQQLESLATMVAPDDPVLAAIDAEVLRAQAVGLASADRSFTVADARARITDLAASVSPAGTSTVTLTGRDGTMPFTFVNDSSTTLSVVLHLQGSKLEFPDGRDLPVVLEPGSTRYDVPIRTRASGSIPLQLRITSPDGQIALADARYSVQSTAVSGVGIVLSAGAMLFLLVWWGRHWRDHRRSTKLVAAADHPTARPPKHLGD